MSQEIVCKECAFTNPAGSKFCNNCGAKLPLGTHIICINCGTSNTIDRIFCDHCGTRLMPEEPRSEAKAKDEPAAPIKGAFSLPARRPGETGDLDPRKVPDWLKTGKTGSEPDFDDLSDQDLPRIEELTRKQHTDDLPEWLVDDEDSDPIIHAPTIISTEFYKDLLGRTDTPTPRTDDLFSEEEADLPDWLADAGGASGKTKTTTEPGELDWLSERQQEPPKTTPPSTPPPAESDKSLTSWLSTPLEDEEEDEWQIPQKPTADSLTSWLSQDIEPPPATDTRDSLTSWLAESPEKADDDWSLTAEQSPSDLTDWLHTGEEPPSSSPDAIRDSLTDWLSDFQDDETLIEDKPATSDAGRLTAWFAEQTEAPEDEMAAAAAGQHNLTDWLADFPEEESEESWGEPTPGTLEAGRLTAWFTDAAATPEEPTAPVSEPEPDGSASWLDYFADDDETAEPFPVVEEADSGGLSAWLFDAKNEPADDDEVAETAVAPAKEEFRLTGWLDEIEDTEDGAASDLPQPAFGEASRLAAWFSGKPAEAEEEPEQFGWLEEPELPAAASAQQELPSDLQWLDETEEELSSIFQSQPGIADELPDWLAHVASSADLIMPGTDAAQADNLEDIFKTERKAAASEIDFLRQTGSLYLDDEMMQKLRLGDSEAEDDAFMESISSDEPDWLAALAAIGPDDLSMLDSEETAVSSSLADDMTIIQPPTETVVDEDEDWISEDPFAAVAQGDELPAWISQLDATAPLPDLEDEEGELVPSDQLPDWVASMRPAQTGGESALTSVWRDKTPETLAGVPEELAGADLPNWLQDISRDTHDAPAIAMPADTQLADIPDWLQPGLTLDAADADFLADSQTGSLDMSGVSDEWSAILDDLPPAVPLQELLPKADIPAWVMELKPVELTGEAPRAQISGPEESFGPLSGLRGVVTVEPVIALPRVADPIEQYVVSPEQRQQVELLRQLVVDGQGKAPVTTRQAGRDVSGLIRPLFVVVTVLMVILGLQGEIPVNVARLQPTPALTGVDTAVRQAAGNTILVAFEYSPAMAGELTPEAETLLSQLAEEQTTILTLSQYTTGVALAEEVAGSVALDTTAVPLGYLPGGAIGLRRLGECLNLDANCDAMFGVPLTASQQSALDDVSLVVVLTADRQTLVNWVEQVGTPAERPIIAGVTQALAPLALPYFDTGQLSGVLNGIPGTAVYQQTYFRNNQITDARLLFNAQVAAQIVVVVVLILGALIYLITGVVAQRRAK
jgi:hypothetical protein